MPRQTGLEHLTLLGVAPPALVAAAAGAGFDAVGLRIAPVTNGERPWPMSPGSPMLAETTRRCADTGVSVLDVEAVRLAPQAPDYGPVLEAAAELGALFVNAICEDPEPSRRSDRFAELAEAAGPYGIRPVIEFMAYRSVRTLADAVAIAAPAGGGILVDALHVQRCGVSMTALAGVDPALIGYVQLCDAPLAAPDDEIAEARSGRLLPGEGSLPLRDLLRALPDGIPVAVEAPRAGAPDSPPQFAARARRALDSVLAQAKERP
ncbi:MAG TPA: TIM barrel protein [Streptosporangiaceae bacterium]|jgi:sugar phosphate isomerase/epimerase|nr:TIM barrel protein [Streptosporangiaceae bacterium]